MPGIRLGTVAASGVSAGGPLQEYVSTQMQRLSLNISPTNTPGVSNQYLFADDSVYLSDITTPAVTGTDIIGMQVKGSQSSPARLRTGFAIGGQTRVDTISPLLYHKGIFEWIESYATVSFSVSTSLGGGGTSFSITPDFDLDVERATLVADIGANVFRIYRQDALVGTATGGQGSMTTAMFNSLMAGFQASGVEITARYILGAPGTYTYYSHADAVANASGALSTELAGVTRWMY